MASGARARAWHGKAGLRTRYRDWTERDDPIHYKKYCGTPPVHMLFGLRKSLDMLFDEGLENVFRRHRILADVVQEAVATWAGGGAMEFNITEVAERAPSVTTILMDNGHDATPLIDYCRERCGVVLGIGDLKGRAFRIAHMGHINAPMVLGTLGVVETGLSALGILHGKGGVQAAIESLARTVKP